MTKRVVAAALGAALLVPAAASAQGTGTPVEAACADRVSKAAGKLSATVLKQTAVCRKKEIAGKAMLPCPDAAAEAKIAKAAAKLADAAGKFCGSTCSASTSIPCLTRSQCPPDGSVVEFCNGGGTRPFDMDNLGFPGPFCEALVGAPIEATADLASCIELGTRATAAELIDAVYGAVDGADEPSKDVAKCLDKTAKAAIKHSATLFKGVAKCRSEIVSGKRSGNPATCASDDEKLAAKLAKGATKFAGSVAKACPAEVFADLDLCLAGLGTVADATAAAACLLDATVEATDPTEPSGLRSYSSRSFVEAMFPPTAGVCGDGVVNQVPRFGLLLGEECDGDDDDACEGLCLPPGDRFECTCGDVPRMAVVEDGFETDTDTGWTGLSHNVDGVDLATYILELSDCDCDDVDGATCVGSSSDTVCNVTGRQRPVCSGDPDSGVRCDATGNGDGTDEDSDCYVCDADSANAGAHCEDETDCQSQCFDAMGAATGACSSQSDCAAGEVCRGLCDQTEHCIELANGGPLPVVVSGNPACNIQVFRDDLTGTFDMVTGAHEYNYQQYTRNHFGILQSAPCPTCGGFCDGGPKDGEPCEGTCSTSGDACRFDADCGEGESCTGDTLACPSGSCNLSLVCNNGPNDGDPCTIDYVDELYGAMSTDCPPSELTNLTGTGQEVDHLPLTSGVVSLPAVVPCTAPGFLNYDCPCSDDGGFQSQPNTCSAACNAGAEFGTGCVTGDTAGAFTTCVGGDEVGEPCDDDADCSGGGSCSANPTHCVGGDPSEELTSCTTNGDCGGGGTCVDACPSGRCVPLCLPDAGDPEEGLCAAGPGVFECEGGRFVNIPCDSVSVGAGCSATCSTAATACSSIADCPDGETCDGDCPEAQLCEAGLDGELGTGDDNVGAGNCVAKPTDCFLPVITAEGGTTLNGDGTPSATHAVSVQCMGSSISSLVDEGAGLGGPRRTRNRLNNFINLPAFAN